MFLEYFCLMIQGKVKSTHSVGYYIATHEVGTMEFSLGSNNVGSVVKKLPVASTLLVVAILLPGG